MEPRRDDVQTFVGITGASEAVAMRMLEEHLGDLNAAINTFFNSSGAAGLPEREEPIRTMDFMDEDELPIAVPPPPVPPPVARPAWGFPAAFPSLDPLRSFFGGDRTGPAPEPFVTEPREVRQVPISWNDPPAGPPSSISIQDITGDETFPRGVTGGIVNMEDDDSPTRPVGIPFPRRSPENEAPNVDYDVEEEMIQAAIEASRRDAEDPEGAVAAAQAAQAAASNEADDIARAVSLSLQTAEEEKRLRDLTGDASVDPPSTAEVTRINPPSGSVAPVVGRRLPIEIDDVEDQPLVRRRSSRRLNVPATQPEVSPTIPPEANIEHAPSAPQPNGGHDEWGGISSEEQDEAMMLEAALFGAINNLPYDLQRAVQAGEAPRPPRSLSPHVVEQRMIREQQDDEYLASLAADREKELKARQEAEAANEKEKQRREDELRQHRAAEELERKLAAKADSLPPEPAQEDDNAVTILVRLPDGSRHGRRFRKSDKLQSLFDFIDVKRVVKSGSYRLVRQYPRRLFTHEEHGASFDSLGLTSKQEALFLESA